MKNISAKNIASKLFFMLVAVIIVALTVSCGGASESETTSGLPETVTEGTTVSETPTEPTSAEEVTTPDIVTEEATTEEATTEEATTEEATTEEITTEEETTVAETKLNYEDMKCLWISQFDLNGVYVTNKKQTDEKKFVSYMETILDNTVELGVNTIILQMRPNADSMYPSEYYPPSGYVVGDYSNDFEYDPIEIIVGMAHERGLSVQAWINPMRAMTDAQLKCVDDKYLIRQWYNNTKTKGKYIVQNGNNWYLNPAYEEVRDLILNGVRELISKYDVDGLHMDDYFYPTTDSSFDSSAYKDYKAEGGKLGVADFRREMLSILVKDMYDAVKEQDPSMLYGISPAGNWKTVYDKQYADVNRWCSEAGFIDYICPQVYFGMEHATFDFVKTSEKWQSMIKDGSNVKLIIGMSLGKAKSQVDNYAGSGKDEWKNNKDVLKRCIEYTENLPKCVGVSYFCYQYFYNPKTGVPVAETKTERENFLPVLKEISWKD